MNQYGGTVGRFYVGAPEGELKELGVMLWGGGLEDLPGYRIVDSVEDWARHIKGLICATAGLPAGKCAVPIVDVTWTVDPDGTLWKREAFGEWRTANYRRNAHGARPAGAGQRKDGA